MTEGQQVPPGIDPATPSPARLYDYYLGGTNNFRADRDAAERIRARMPELADAAERVPLAVEEVVERPSHPGPDLGQAGVADTAGRHAGETSPPARPAMPAASTAGL